MAQFLTYARFQTIGDSGPLTEMLTMHGIPYSLGHEENQLGAFYIGDGLDPMFVLKIPQQSFPELNTLLAEKAAEDYAGPGFLHWADDDSAEELQEILDRPEGGGAYDLEIARLSYQKKTGRAFIPRSQADAGYRPERLDRQWVALGYLLCLLTICGVFFGLAITQGKKTLSDGKIVPIYDEPTHRHGRRMIVIGAAVTVFLVLAKFAAAFRPSAY